MTNDPYDGPVGEHFDVDSPPNRGPIPGADPRIEALKDKPIMHTQPQSEFAQPAKTPVYGSLTNLIDRLEHIYSYAAGLHNNMVGLNTKLGGPVPQENDKNQPDKPDNCLAIAHALVTDIEHRLHAVESEIKRLHDNIGE